DAELAAVIGTPRRAASTVSSLQGHRALIEGWVEQGVSGVAIHAALTREHGWRCSYSSVRRLVADIQRAAPAPTTIRLEHPPAEAAQVDFGAGPMLADQRGSPR